MRKVIESLATGGKNKKKNKDAKNKDGMKNDKVSKRKILCSECKECYGLSNSYVEYDISLSSQTDLSDRFLCKSDSDSILIMPNEFNMNINIENHKHQKEKETTGNTITNSSHPTRIKNFCSNENDFINYKYDYVLNKFN
jgi:hypothetical protein